MNRTPKANELNYSTVDKEVLALLRILICVMMLVTRSFKVLTRHSTLVWLVKSSGLRRRLGNWAALLSQCTLVIVKCKKGKYQVLGVFAVSITLRESVDSILSAITPKKQAKKKTDLPTPTVENDEELHVLSFDVADRVKQRGGACSASAWSLPTWLVVSAASKYLKESTVNEAEYEGMLLGFEFLERLERRLLIICGDSNLFVRQTRGDI
uniref:Reverse transcriptase RNase H-like domain-containing protein n=1 Tax=Peronospora matthiolae TaxID=2874970 RepID=A0AAV1TLR7_9STRA